MLIHGILLKKSDLAILKSNVDKLDIDKWKIVPNNLCNLKIKVDKLDVDKLVPLSADLNKLSDVVRMLLKKILDIPDTTNLTTNTTFDAKINEVKNEISSITNLATTTALTAVREKS